MAGHVDCIISDIRNPVCTLGWMEPTTNLCTRRLSRKNNFVELDPPEVYYSYRDSVKAVTNAIMRLEELPQEEAMKQAERRVWVEMTQAIGSSSEIWRYGRLFGWKDRW